ncbi:MAG: transposase, partial [Alkaliphilus sp.]|nr:transposase [Alkaliphilus sp.]
MRKLIDKIRLNKEQREKLIKAVEAQKSEQREMLRAKIILLLWEGNDENEVANQLGINIKTVRKWRDRFHASCIFTPKHASWINRIEIFFLILHRRCLKLSSFKSKEELKQMVIKFIKLWNDKEGHAFNWA